MPQPSAFYTWVDGSLQSSIVREGPLALDAVTIELVDRTILAALRDLVPKDALDEVGVTRAADLYDALEDGDDKDRLTEAVGLLAASRLIGPLSTGGANGQLLSEKTETVSRTFAAGPGNKEEWEARAFGLVAECAFAPPIARESVTLFAATGPTRARRPERGGRLWR